MQGSYGNTGSLFFKHCVVFFQFKIYFRYIDVFYNLIEKYCKIMS